MEPYRVFISSIMDKSKEDLWPERMAAKLAVERFHPITMAWAFEHEPASSKPLLDFYLEAVKTSDLLVLILGDAITAPVRAEVDAARDHGKPILVFVKSMARQTVEVMEVLRQIDRKYDRFENSTELAEKLRRSLGNEILSLIRGEDGSASGSSSKLAKLRRIMRDSREVVILPRIPTANYPLCSVQQIGPTSVTFGLAGGVEVHIPIERISEVLDPASGQVPEVHIRGRIQLVSFPRSWKFFSQPDSNALDQIGVGVLIDREGQRSREINAEVQRMGYSVAWASREKAHDYNAPGSESSVYYDVSGLYYYSGSAVLCIRRNR